MRIPRPPVVRRASMTVARVLATAGAGGLLLAAFTASPAAGLPAPASTATGDEAALIARNLAENILGKGQVRTSRVTSRGRTVEMIWESATYKPANPPAHTRELLLAEVQLVAGAIFRVLTSVDDLRFEIVLKKRSLCTGTVARGRPPVVAYARELGE